MTSFISGGGLSIFVSCSMWYYVSDLIGHTTVCAKERSSSIARSWRRCATDPTPLLFFDSQSSSNSRFPRRRTWFTMRSSLFSISLLRPRRQKHQPSTSLACFFLAVTKSGLISIFRCYLSVCFCFRQSLQCHFLFELGTVATSLMYLSFCIYVCWLIIHTPAVLHKQKRA